MTTFTVRHICGHEASHAYSGPEDGLARRKDWLRLRPCQVCWKQEETAQAAVRSREMNLPELNGAEHDRAWAEVIRYKAVMHSRDYVEKLARSKKVADEDEAMRTAILSSAREALLEIEGQREAGWWISNRFEVLSFVKSRVVMAVTPILESRSR